MDKKMEGWIFVHQVLFSALYAEVNKLYLTNNYITNQFTIVINWNL